MTTTYIPDNDTWHETAEVVVPGERITAATATDPVKAALDNAQWIYERAVYTDRTSVTVAGTGTIEFESVPEDGHIFAVLVEVCGGGEGGEDGDAGIGGKGGAGAAYARRMIGDNSIGGTFNYQVGAGGAAGGGTGEASWVNLGNYGILYAAGGRDGGWVSSATADGISLRSPANDITNWPAQLGWGWTEGGSASGGTGIDGRSNEHMQGGEGGGGGSVVGQGGVGYGAGGGGGRNASGGAAGGGGGGAGWFRNTVAGAPGVTDQGGAGRAGRVEITIWYTIG